MTEPANATAPNATSDRFAEHVPTLVQSVFIRRLGHFGTVLSAVAFALALGAVVLQFQTRTLQAAQGQQLQAIAARLQVELAQWNAQLVQDTDNSTMTPEQSQATMKKWEDWVGGIAAQGRLSSQGNRLASQGKVLRASGIISDGPFVELKEKLGGYIIVKAADLDDATTLAHGCPSLDVQGSVEIRPLYT